MWDPRWRKQCDENHYRNHKITMKNVKSLKAKRNDHCCQKLMISKTVCQNKNINLADGFICSLVAHPCRLLDRQMWLLDRQILTWKDEPFLQYSLCYGQSFHLWQNILQGKLISSSALHKVSFTFKLGLFVKWHYRSTQREVSRLMKCKSDCAC